MPDITTTTSVWIEPRLSAGDALMQGENNTDVITIYGLNTVNDGVNPGDARYFDNMWLLYRRPSGLTSCYQNTYFPANAGAQNSMFMSNTFMTESGRYLVQGYFFVSSTAKDTDNNLLSNPIEIERAWLAGKLAQNATIMKTGVFEFYVHESLDPLEELYNQTTLNPSDSAMQYLENYMNNLVQGELSSYVQKAAVRNNVSLVAGYADTSTPVNAKAVIEHLTTQDYFKKSDIIDDVTQYPSSTTKVPNSKAVKDYVDDGLATKIGTSDRSNDISGDASSTTKVPSVNAIKDYVDGQVTIINNTYANVLYSSDVSSDIEQDASSPHVYVPSVSATKLFVDGKVTTLSTAIDGKINKSDRSNDILGDASSTTKVPSVKAIKDYVDANYVSQPIVWVSLPTTVSSGSAQSGIIGNASVYSNTITVSQSNLELFEAVITALNSQDDVYLNSNSYPLAKTPNPSDSNYGSLYYNAEVIPVSSGGDGWSTLRRTDTTKPVFAIILSQDQQDNDVINMFSSNAFTNGEWDVIYTGDYLTQNTAAELFDQRYIPKDEIVTAQSDITTYASSTTKIPSVKAIKDYVDASGGGGGSYIPTSNIVTTSNGISTYASSTSKVTSVKAIKEYVDSAISTAIGNAIGGSY